MQLSYDTISPPCPSWPGATLAMGQDGPSLGGHILKALAPGRTGYFTMA